MTNQTKKNGSGKMDKIHQLFVQNVSHELRTPLSIIQGYTELLYEGDLGALTQQQRDALSLIRNKSHKLRELVEEIGILLAVENGNRASVPVAMAEMATTVIEKRRKAATEAEVKLDSQARSDLPLVLGDPYQLQKAIDALVDNGIKFTPAGGQVKIETYTETNAGGNNSSERPAWICLRVSDTGVGIAQEKLGHIFSSFYQADGSATRRYGGLGTGLTVAKAVVESHGGQIEVESQLDQGSRFTIKLPSLPPEAEIETSASPRLQRVLVVDDEVNVALFMQAALEDLPHCEIDIATNGKQALQLFEQHPFDLLITDYQMPGTDGITLATEVRERYPRTVVIMITAYADEALRRSADRIAIQQVLDKPVKLAQIRSLASEALKEVR